MTTQRRAGGCLSAFGTLVLGLLVACGVETPTSSEEALHLDESVAELVEPPDGRELYFGRCPTAADARGRTLYVSKTGPWTPSEPVGSSANPYRTVGAALSAAQPGNVINVRPGTYAEQLVISPSTTRSGTASAPIVVRGASDWRSRIVPPSNRAVSSLLHVSQPYWIFQSLEVNIQGKAAFAALFERNTYCSQLIDSRMHAGTAGGAVVLSGANNVLIDNSEIYDFSKTDADSHGVVLKNASREIFVLANDIHAMSGDSVQCQTDGNRPAFIFVEYNELHGTGENGVDIKGCDSVFVRHNSMYNFPNLTRYPWQANTSAAEAVVIHEDATNVQIVSNVISHAGRGISVGSTSPLQSPVDILIRNNTISDIFNFAKRGNGQGIRIVQANRVQIRANLVQRTADAGLRLAADEPLSAMGLTVYDNILRDMELFVRLGRVQYRPEMEMDRNRYEGPSGRFTATGLVNNVEFPEWRSKLAPEGLEQNSVRIP
ncbi:right-handed parallel beta-helix repeat-containing protein [Myxococcus landrumensis]|uniref:Right-handed parallel beta-helix repeat-containing protein n=1 Tax=Myxococcus landrumensis TaxID=2813577 RepID=A0ABX7N8B2_9BACT|nr:right-handed parallel beta-helix repeat-containing protein [Myxococcus landrumus]QSQ13900.1 right-handed parallel beta-helix repeat-containing protein [Myxococcus landrumus]